ncbi:BolA family transcriptional regulator [Moraxella haemolytica]|uniref:BolA family protein n=1 Tax=Moraxella haemolytica TaxID=2904119 RepID=UPI002542F1E3|nr:BolA family protein [Moraxella sp. ZY171148]WII95486.1 BolA family transcriptional regulator [Moraxella sp. ZY171148]
MNTPTQDAIIQAMQTLLPTHLSLENESHKHAGYFEGKESHFKLVVVSQGFIDKRLVARHQMVYLAVQPLLMANGGSIHALAIHAYTPDEWAALGRAPNSPNCAGQHLH